MTKQEFKKRFAELQADTTIGYNAKRVIRPDTFLTVSDWADHHKLTTKDLCDIFDETTITVKSWLRGKTPSNQSLQALEYVSVWYLDRRSLQSTPYSTATRRSRAFIKTENLIPITEIEPLDAQQFNSPFPTKRHK